MQNAHPLICDARILTNSSSGGSRPDPLTAWFKRWSASYPSAQNRNIRLRVLPCSLVAAERRGTVLTFT